jgi:AraC family transcriptional regulator, transcriptional activator of pobA
VNKDKVQRFDNKNELVGKAILFTDDFFSKSDFDTKFLKNNILFNDLISISHIQLKDQFNLVKDLFDKMEIELKNEIDNFQTNILQNLLHNLLLHSERERRKKDFIEIKKGASLNYVLLFKDSLETNFRIQKQVKFYSKQINITEKKLNQATTKILGKTPKNIIDERVLLEAKRVLSQTAKSVNEVGYYLGFEEPTNFIKYFKKHLHITPAKFRDKVTMD